MYNFNPVKMKKTLYPFNFLFKLLIYILIFVTSVCIIRTFTHINISYVTSSCTHQNFKKNHLISSSKLMGKLLSTTNINTSLSSVINPENITKTLATTKSTTVKTELHHIVFGIGASSKLWHRRKEYIKLWWKRNETRGYIWLDQSLESFEVEEDDPPTKVSSDTSRFKYSNKKGDRSAIRISRIISETFRLGLKNVRWFVMGDDDTMFIVDNLVRVLQKYDHNDYYYIGSSSESHIQNTVFSYNMAYGGGGFAVSYPLAKALEKIQDECIQRYSNLYGSDDRIQACMAELGVPLTKEVGFHQMDVYGNIFGLLAAHPVAPLVSIHHLDIIDPIFPNMDQIDALEKLKVSIDLDSAGFMQQSICHDKLQKITISVSWGFVVQIVKGLVSFHELERPVRTFVDWYRRTDQYGFTFNTRGVQKDKCDRASVYVFTNAVYNPITNQTASEYISNVAHDHPKCKRQMANPVHRVEVYKKVDPYLWDKLTLQYKRQFATDEIQKIRRKFPRVLIRRKSPRRNCCRILSTQKKDTMVIDVGVCREDEISG